MSDDADVAFDIILADGRIAHCQRATSQPYADCEFSGGFVEGIGPDTLYLRVERDGEGATTIFLRRDEALAMAWVLLGTLWSETMMMDASADV